MLSLAAADGTRVLCATPHAFGPDYDVARASAAAAHEALAAAARAAGIPLELRLRVRGLVPRDLDVLAREGRLACSGRKAALRARRVPADPRAPGGRGGPLRLRLEGVTPVIAHPERNPLVLGEARRRRAPARAGRPPSGDGRVFHGPLPQGVAGLRPRPPRSRRRGPRRERLPRLRPPPPGLAQAARLVAKWKGANEPSG